MKRKRRKKSKATKVVKNINTNKLNFKIMITILSFTATNGKDLMYGEVTYDLITRESIYSSFSTISNKVEQKKYKSIVIPTAYYQADLKFALKKGYEIKIDPLVNI